MDVIAITGPKTCAVIDRPEPKAYEAFAKVKIQAAPMCTEFQGYRDGKVNDCLGHEAAGTVVDLGRNSDLKVGSRVVVMPENGCGQCPLCQSGEHIHCEHPVLPPAEAPKGRATYAQYLIQKDWLLLPIPEDIDTVHASMACCGLGPTFNAMVRMQVNALHTVLVSGLGPVGMGAVVNARVRGARVLALESHPWRIRLAKELGADQVFDPRDPEAANQILAATGGLGADKSVETSSAQGAPALLVKATRRRGEIASVGWGGPVEAAALVGKGLTMHGVWHWNHQRDAEAMWRTIRAGRPLLDRMITNRFPMRQVQKAWDLQLTGESGKIILDPWG